MNEFCCVQEYSVVSKKKTAREMYVITWTCTWTWTMIVNGLVFKDTFKNWNPMIASILSKTNREENTPSSMLAYSIYYTSAELDSKMQLLRFKSSIKFSWVGKIYLQPRIVNKKRRNVHKDCNKKKECALTLIDGLPSKIYRNT